MFSRLLWSKLFSKFYREDKSYKTSQSVEMLYMYKYCYKPNA